MTLAGEVTFEHRTSVPMAKEPSCQPGMDPSARSGAWCLPRLRGQAAAAPLEGAQRLLAVAVPRRGCPCEDSLTLCPLGIGSQRAGQEVTTQVGGRKQAEQQGRSTRGLVPWPLLIFSLELVSPPLELF